MESMFSYTTMWHVHGETAFADRAEQIAFNALPATWFGGSQVALDVNIILTPPCIFHS